MASILVILNRAGLICLFKFTFARIIDVPRPRSHYKFQDEELVEMFLEKLKSAASPKQILEFFFQRFVWTLIGESFHGAPLFGS